MKRLVAFVAALLWLLPAVRCAAVEEDFYSAYTPRSASSSVFYIDVFCTREVTAAVFELQYDDSMVSYYSVSTVSASADVRDRAQSGRVTVAFADSAAVSGQLCRFSFKALQAGTAEFTLHMRQAADANRTKLQPLGDHTLTVKLGKDDIAPSVGADRSVSVSSPVQLGGDRSYLNENVGEASDDSPQGGIFDLRGNDSRKWMLLGAGITVLIAALVFIGILIGRKTKNPAKKETPSHEATEKDVE